MNPQEIVDRQPVGALIVDGEGVVRFANPAASRLLDVPSERLIGEEFGLPVLPGGVTDVNVPGPDGVVRTLAMRTTELEGGAGGHLISLFDVSGRARRYEHEHRLVEALQRSLLLDRMPQVPGVALTARYLPGDDEIRVGGDWYDAIPLEGGAIGLAIGDVAGHGIGSVALMSQLRNAMRAYALEHVSPATVLTRLDQLLERLEPEGMATAVYVVYDRTRREVEFSVAGHPYPLLVRPDGTREFLTGGRSQPLGIPLPGARSSGRAELPDGATLILYTDGLVERRIEPIDDGLAALAAAVDPTTDDLDALCDTLLDALDAPAAANDDIAVLIMRATAP